MSEQNPLPAPARRSVVGAWVDVLVATIEAQTDEAPQADDVPADEATGDETTGSAVAGAAGAIGAARQSLTVLGSMYQAWAAYDGTALPLYPGAPGRASTRDAAPGDAAEAVCWAAHVALQHLLPDRCRELSTPTSGQPQADPERGAPESRAAKVGRAAALSVLAAHRQQGQQRCAADPGDSSLIVAWLRRGHQAVVDGNGDLEQDVRLLFGLAVIAVEATTANCPARHARERSDTAPWLRHCACTHRTAPATTADRYDETPVCTACTLDVAGSAWLGRTADADAGQGPAHGDDAGCAAGRALGRDLAAKAQTRVPRPRRRRPTPFTP